jgi:glycosyltransferase involved in cell wall biosynthesis
MLACKDQTPELKLEHAICVSQAVRQRLSDASLPLTSAKVIYNGIDLAPFLATRKLRVQRRRTDALALLYAGRLSPDKGVHTAIEAIARLAHQGYMVTLIILGGGSRDYEAELHRLCRRLGVSDRVMFRGRVPRAQMPEVLSQFDVLVFPAIGPESLPRIVQEAMAAGLAVVGTEVGGMSEILVNGVNGLTFTPGDAHELAMRVEQLILDPNLHSQLAKAGQHTVRERFDIRRMLDEIEVYLQRVVAG